MQIQGKRHLSGMLKKMGEGFGLFANATFFGFV